jgi:hypothetical protein
VSTSAKKRRPGGGGGAGGGAGDGNKGSSKGGGSSSGSSSNKPSFPRFTNPFGGGKSATSDPRGGQGGSERADRSKADFSAYWALRFREFFSKRRRYLDLINKPAKGDADPPELQERIEAQLEVSAERNLMDEIRLLEARELGIDPRDDPEGEEAERRREVLTAAIVEVRSRDPEIRMRAAERMERIWGKKRTARALGRAGILMTAADGGAPPTAASLTATPLTADFDAMERAQAREARAYVASSRVRVVYNAMQLAANVARLIVTSPIAVPVFLYRRWRALFETPDYDFFIDREAQRLWYWRNRSENERWFWEIYFWDRVLLPTVWTLVYVAAAPANLLWCAVVPLLMLAWRDGRMQGPGDYEWWLLMVFGVFGKCRGQILELARAGLAWGV